MQSDLFLKSVQHLCLLKIVDAFIIKKILILTLIVILLNFGLLNPHNFKHGSLNG